MFAKPPARLLLLRPDAYGDLFLFEPVPRLLRHLWPETEVAVLIRKPYEDAAPLLAFEGVRWLTTACNPYREGPAENPTALAELRETVRAFAPDCVVAACFAQTWLEAAVAAFLPGARQVSLGDGECDPVVRASLDAVLSVDWTRIYPEKILVEPERSEWEKNLGLVTALTGGEVPRWWPVARVPEAARAAAAGVLAGAGLPEGGFAVCAAAGIANVQIKAWPIECYGETLAWLERERGIRALLIGHLSERRYLEDVRATARQSGGDPALWLGQDGEMPVLAGLIEAARFYFGNDTGALHLAAALGKPVVSIFGGGHWPRFEPVADRALTIVQPLPCFGCAWDCYFADAPCVRTISPASVRLALTRFLDGGLYGRTIFDAEGLAPGARTLIEAAMPRLRFLREDNAARAKQIAQLTAWVLESRAAHRELLETRAVGETRFLPTAPASAATEAGADSSILADLRRRLQGSEAQEQAARTETRRYADELSITRRLLKFAVEDQGAPAGGSKHPLVTRATAKLPRLRAALTADRVSFHFDAFEKQGVFLVVSGWAFRRAAGWNRDETAVSLLFRHGADVRQFATSRVLRPDVAAYFAAQGPDASGGARHLEGAGFTCRVPRASLPEGVNLDIILRLESAGRVCEQPTGEQLSL